MRLQFSDPFQDTACLDKPRKMPCFTWTKIKYTSEVLYQRGNFRPFSDFFFGRKQVKHQENLPKFAMHFHHNMKNKINSHLGGAVNKHDRQNGSSFQDRGGNSESLGHQHLTKMQVKVIQ